MSLQNYTEALLDPFSNAVSQLKLADGKVPYSAGVKLRSTGEITCALDGTVTYVCLFPGLSTVMAWEADEGEKTCEPFPGHLGAYFDFSDRSKVKLIRTVGTGLKLSLLNSADNNEGYWEAVRLHTNASDFVIHHTIIGGSTEFPLGDGDGRFYLPPTFMDQDFSNYQTYQSGKLRDLHRYQFKLNTINNEHDFGKISPTTMVNSEWIDEDWDTVIIKIHGRVDATTPTVLRYEAVSNQEVVYQDNTSLGRLMGRSTYLPFVRNLLESTKYELPAVQVE